MIPIDKHANHPPLNRQCEQYERDGPLGRFADAGELVREYGYSILSSAEGSGVNFAHAPPARAETPLLGKRQARA